MSFQLNGPSLKQTDLKLSRSNRLNRAVISGRGVYDVGPVLVFFPLVLLHVDIARSVQHSI